MSATNSIFIVHQMILFTEIIMYILQIVTAPLLFSTENLCRLLKNYKLITFSSFGYYITRHFVTTARTIALALAKS